MTFPANFNTAKFRQAADRVSNASGTDINLLRFLKSGEWVFGPEDMNIEDGSKWAFAPQSLRLGYQCWKEERAGNELVGEITRSYADEELTPADLPDHGENSDWKELFTIMAACVSGEDKGEQVLYKATSRGGHKAINKVLSQVANRIDQGLVEVMPVCTLEVSSYAHKKYGKIYAPDIKIHSWLKPDEAKFSDPAELEYEEDEVDVEEVEEVEEVEVEEEPKAKPARRLVRRKR